jgi:hypothetical protein
VITRVALLMLAAFLSVVAGCGNSGSAGGSAPSAISTSSGGWRLYRPSGGGYTIELPPDWNAIDARAIADAGGVAQYTRDHPAMSAEMKTSAAVAHSPGTLAATDHSAAGISITTKTRFLPNILVHRLDLRASADDATLLEAIISTSLKNAEALAGGGGKPTGGTLTMAPMPARWIRYEVLVPRSDGGSNWADEVDNIVVKDGIAYSVSCTSTRDDYARIAPDCARAIESFTLIG